jgi:glycerol kinase
MQTNQIKEEILHGKTVLGIERGSTRIKAVLINSENQPIAQGAHDWENTLLDGVWTYALDDVWKGIQSCFASLQANIQHTYALKLRRTKALGVSAMMHGYLPFDSEGRQLAAFRTWRNTMTSQAAEELGTLFDYPVPERWSISHLYQANLNKEEHVKDLGFLTTLAGYVHWQLTGEKVLGIGDASGMFPVDTKTGRYDTRMLKAFADLTRAYKFHGSWRQFSVHPYSRRPCRKSHRNRSTSDRSSGTLEAGIPLCPLKVMQEPAWLPPTASPSVPAMFQRVPRFSP